MYKHLFLESSSGAGKSTLLKELLNPYINSLGGFSGQRLLNSNGDTKAFRIGPAGNTPLTAPFSNKYVGGCDGVFRINTDKGKAIKFPEIFDNDGVKYLTENDSKQIILLDEIGGVELLSDAFRKSLYDLLADSIPCIGVIKEESKVEFMSRTAGYTQNVVYYNRELRQRITELYGGKILPFKRDDMEIRKEVEDFLCGIFTTK